MNDPSSIERGQPTDGAWFRPAAIALLAFALGLRLIGLGKSLWIDEAGSLSRASAQNFWAAAHADVHPPLYFLLLRVGLQLTHSFALLRLFSVACGLGLVAAATFFLRRTPIAAIALGAIFAGLPELVRHSQELRPYSLLVLALGVAMLLSIRIARGEATGATRIWLCLAALVAAGTHVAAAFFLLALAPLLAWPELRSGARRIAGSLAPLTAAALLLAWLELDYLRSPAGLPEGWWIPPATVGQVVASLGDAVGWTEVGQFADAVSRHMPGGGALVRAVAAAAAAVGVWAAWGRRPLEPVPWLLLASGLIYMGSLIAFSWAFEPLVIGRTLLPGLLPIAAGMALGVGANPRGVVRVAAAACITVFVLMACETGVRGAFVPREGLRGLAAAVRARYRPGDQLVLFRSMDYGLAPYWEGVLDTRPLLIDQTKPIQPQLAEVRQRLGASRGPSACWSYGATTTT